MTGGRRLPASLLPLWLAACVAAPPHATLAAPQPVFWPQAFFAGRTIGDGVLRIALSRARHVGVTGDGRIEADGTLILIQQVEEEGRPPRTRTWRLRTLPDGRLAAALSDARGPVAVDVQGNRLHVRFAAGGGLDIEQWLYLQPDGRSALNRMVVRKLGLPVAALRETIRRMP